MIYSKKLYRDIIKKVIGIFIILLGLFISISLYIYFYLDNNKNIENARIVSENFNNILKDVDTCMLDRHIEDLDNEDVEANLINLYYNIKQNTDLDFQMIFFPKQGSNISFGYSLLDYAYIKTYSKILNYDLNSIYTTSLISKGDGYIVKTKSYNSGDLCLYISASSIEDKLNEYASDYFISDRYGKILINNISYIEKNMNSIRKISNDSLNNKNYSHKSMEVFPFEVHSFKQRIISPTSFWISFILLLLISFSLIATLIIVVKQAVEDSTKSIEMLNKEINLVSRGELELINLRTEDEIQDIIDNINELIVSKRILFDNNLKLKYINKYSKFKMLESQFNPHFLYNTLELISITMYIDPDISDKILRNLTEILRYSINELSFIRLDEDIEYIYKFLEIQKVKFEDKLSYELNIDQESAKVLVPKLFLQPLIENSIKYARKNISEIFVKIDISTDNNIFTCQIFDNGNSLLKSDLKILNKNIIKDASEDYLSMEHHGLANSFNRLKLLYKENIDMQFVEVDYGVLLSIKIDLR